MTIALLWLFAAAALVAVLVGTARSNGRRRLRDAIFDVAARLPISDARIDEAGIEADWVALHLCGKSIDEKISVLPPLEQAHVLEIRENVVAVASGLVADGLLRRMEVTFACAAKNQKTNPPRTLFLLTSRGVVEVLKRRGGCVNGAA